MGWLRGVLLLYYNNTIQILLYMNDIVRSSSILKFLLSTDDTSLVYHSRDINELVNAVNTELDHDGWMVFLIIN